MNLHIDERNNFQINLLLGLDTALGKTQLLEFVAQKLGISNSFRTIEEGMRAIHEIRPELDGLRGIRDLAISLGYSPKESGYSIFQVDEVHS